MAKKLTRAEQYNAILKDRTIGQCEVLSFAFNSESGPEMFHYDLMNGSAEYILFDCRKDKAMASVIIERGIPVYRERIIELAKRNGGAQVAADLN